MQGKYFEYKYFCYHKNFSFNGILMTKSGLSFGFTKVRVLVFV